MGRLSMGEFCLFIWASPASLLEKGEKSHFKISHVSCNLDLDPEGSVLRIFLSVVLPKYLQTSTPLSALLMEGQSTWQPPGLSPLPLLPARHGAGRERTQLCPSVMRILKNLRGGRE